MYSFVFNFSEDLSINSSKNLNFSSPKFSKNLSKRTFLDSGSSLNVLYKASGVLAT
jgi:hypothetical protein